MMLNGGELKRHPRIQSVTIAKFTRAADPARSTDSARPRLGHRFAAFGNRGELFPIGSFGHTVSPAPRSGSIFDEDLRHSPGDSVHPDLRLR